MEYVLLAAIMSACMLLAWDYILSSSVSTVYYVIVQQIEKIFWGVAW